MQFRHSFVCILYMCVCLCLCTNIYLFLYRKILIDGLIDTCIAKQCYGVHILYIYTLHCFQIIFVMFQMLEMTVFVYNMSPAQFRLPYAHLPSSGPI